MRADPPADLDLFLALTLAASKAWPLIRAEFEAAGVDPSNWGLLVHAGAREHVTPSQLAAETGVTTTTIRDQVQGLVERGLLVRDPNPRDARSYFVRLTARGHRELELGLAASKSAREAIEEELGDTSALRSSLLELVAALDAVHERTEEATRAQHVAQVLGRRRSQRTA